ncbi:hypothetical protein J3Q64DRAFT_1768296 [Phycomyces blakesleeanus]|uniref:ubiquitinyl hydrolase 1 n=1 Tax=Phycomyces blakesleeanus TaxID=4837 RepID=A0ABR3AM05_PHYBL
MEDIFHFVSYIYKNGYVWELDGLNQAPIKLEQCNVRNWTEVVKPYLVTRMQSAEDGSLFNMMAVTDATLPIKLRDIADKTRLLETYTQRIESEKLRLPEHETALGKHEQSKSRT